VLGSSIETWKTGCTACIVVGRQSVQDRGPTWLMISKGFRYFSESFFEGRVVQKNFAFTKALSPTLNFGGGIQFLSADCW
jgi:hypothetical protein